MTAVNIPVLVVCVLILLLKPGSSSLLFCHYEFDLAGEAEFNDNKVKSSQELYCACGINSCSFQISYSHTSTLTHTIEGNLGFSIKMFTPSLGYSHSWGESATTSSSVTCTINPGYKVWVTVVPKMIRKLGWGRKICVGITIENGWVDMKAPLRTEDGALKSDVWCNATRFSKCSENTNGGVAQCHGINEYKSTHDTYCRDNCAAGYCPPEICEC